MSYSSQIKTVFSGPSSSTTPPHNGLAVGSKYVVMVEGSRIEWTDLSGGSPTVESTYTFFAPLSPTGGLYDQRCYWDPVNQRYIVIMQYEASVAGEIDIAISKDSNPNDGWYFAQLNTSLTINGQTTGSDRPMLAIDGSNIYITAAEYNVNGGYVGTECWTIGDTAGAGGGVYNGGTLTVTASELTPSSQGIYAVVAGNNGKTYYACDYSNGGQIVVALQTYDVATNTFGPTATVGLGNIDQGSTYTAQQMGTSLLLDAGDRRIASVAYANGFLYAVAVMEAPGASVPSVHWFKIDVSNPNAPNLVAQGDISGAAIGTNVATFNPSIAVDGSGDVIINFTASGPNMYPGDYYVFQGAHDPTGSFGAPILYQASTGFFNSGNGSTVQRWGVNSSATVDPNNPNSFWISNEYVASGWWQTSVAQVAIQNPAIVMVSSIVTSGTGITSGGGDLNAGHVVTLTVNFTGTVTVNTTGGAPTLKLNDGGTATYTGGSGSTALTFSYTVAAGQNTPDLGVAAFNLNGATVTDGSGNTADVSGATNLNPAGTLVIDTTAPVPAFSQEPPSTTGSTTAVFAFTTSNTETGGVSYAYELDGATTWTPFTGNTLSLSGLAVGSHVIQLQATDGAGNVSTSPASYSWTVTPPAAQIKTQFSGISVTGTYPPNNALAVGPNYIVTMEASRIEWTNLTGGSPVLQSVYSFFSPLGSSADNSLNHPRAIYDSVNQRYIMVMDNNASGHTISTIDIAVSKDSNPNDGWYLAALNTSVTINGQLTAADSPTIAVDGTNIYITATQYNVNVSGTAGTEAWVIGDTAGVGGGIYNGGTLTAVANEVLPASQSIFTVAAGNNGNAYYASDYSNGSQMVVVLQTYNAATNTFGATSTIGLGNIDQGGSYTAQQLGTSLLLNAGDKRARSLVYANGFVYGVAELMPIGSSVPEVHWFKINVSNPNAPTLAAQGDISGAAIGTNVATFNGSIAVDASGDVLINFVASGPNMYPADYYVYQKGSDPAGAFSAPILYQASTGFFNSGASGVQSWGNYSTATVDPNNPNSFWISNEYVANNWWQTSVAQVALEGAEAPTLAIANTTLSVTAGSSVPLGITATPVDSDDILSVTIAGVPTYEAITAPAGDTVTSSLQADGTKTWTVTEGASTKGTALTGLTLSSSYTGSDHPVATFTVTANNTTSGEAASSAPLTMSVTDPPATTSTGSGGLVGNSAIQNSGNIGADGGNVALNGAATGTGTVTISGSSTLEFGAASDDNTSFAAGATGTLKLDQAKNFSGSVSGFGAGDKLDLSDIAFGANLTLGYSANAASTGGMLSVSDGTHSASIALFGQFAAAGFKVGSDAGSGTMVTYTPPDQRTASLITLPKS
jgi:hypothetical protein